MDTIGKRLKWARERKGWSLSQTAKAAKMARSYVWTVERDEQNITVGKLGGLADALEVSLPFLVTGQDAPSEYQPADNIQIPQALAEMAQEYDGLSFAQILSLLEIWRLCRGPMDKQAWVKLWGTVRGMT